MIAHIIERRANKRLKWCPVVVCRSKREAEKDMAWLRKMASLGQYRIVPYIRKAYQ